MAATLYISQNDIVPLRMPMKLFVQLTNDDAEADTPDADTVALVLAEACAEVDSFCAMRYQLPLAPSVLVKSLARDIAIYHFYKRRPRNLKEGDMVTTGYQGAIARLKDIGAGRASLDQPDAPLDDQVTTSEVLVMQAPQLFGDQNLGGW